MDLITEITYAAIVAESIYTSEFKDKACWGDNSSALILTRESFKEKNSLDKEDVTLKLIDWLENGTYSSQRLVNPDKITVKALLEYKSTSSVTPSIDGASSENLIGRLLAVIPFIKDKSFKERKDIITECVKVTQDNPLSLISSVVLVELIVKTIEAKLKGEVLFERKVKENVSVQTVKEKEEIFDRSSLSEEIGKYGLDAQATVENIKNTEKILKMVASRMKKDETEVIYHVDFMEDVMNYVDEEEIYGDINTKDFLNRTFLNDVSLLTNKICLNLEESQLSVNDRIDNTICSAFWYSTRKDTYEECVDMAITAKKPPSTVFLTGYLSALLHGFNTDYINNLIDKKTLTDKIET